MVSIPRFIHQVWLQGSDKIPSKYEKIRYSWLEMHPKWYYRLWGERQLFELLKNNYSIFIPTYAKLKHNIQKIHFFQYLLMYHFGGIVVHVDILCKQNIEHLLEGYKLVFAAKYDKKGLPLSICSQRNIKELPYLTTSFLASSERNPFWLEVRII